MAYHVPLLQPGAITALTIRTASNHAKHLLISQISRALPHPLALAHAIAEAQNTLLQPPLPGLLLSFLTCMAQLLAISPQLLYLRVNFSFFSFQAASPPGRSPLVQDPSGNDPRQTALPWIPHVVSRIL